MNVTLGQLVEFVLKNRKGRAFYDCSEQHIAFDIWEAAKEGTMLYAVDNDKEICGIVVASKVEEMQMMFIKNILTTQPWAIKRFVEIFQQRYPDYRLRAQRWHGKDKPKMVDYKTERLCSKILNKKV